MSRPALQRLLTLLTLALAMVVPLRVQAAIVQVCEEDATTVIPAPPEPLCTIVTTVDDATGETTAAPLCDPRGASMLAPPRILPVADGRIEATPRCQRTSVSPTVTPGSQDRVPMGPLVSTPHQAVLVPEPPLPPAPLAALLSATPVTGGPRSGIDRAVYHPPR